MVIFIFFISIPCLFFILVEVGLRLAKIDTEFIKSKHLKVVTPIWAANDINFFATRGIYRDILDNNFPVQAANWMRYFEEAPYVGYRMKPDLNIRIFNTINKREVTKGHKVSIYSNSLGFRSPEIPLKKESGNYRIVFIGDSTTFGWGVNQDERFSELLQKRLNDEAKCNRFEIINLGIPGYTSLHALHSFTCFAIPYSPDLVICSFGANDSKPITKNGKKILKKSGRMERLRYFLLKFKTYQLLRKWMVKRVNPFDRLGKPGNIEKTEPVASIFEFTQNLQAIIEQARRHHTRVAFLSLCCPIDYWETMSKVARENDLPFIDGMNVLIRGVEPVSTGKRFPEMAAALRTLMGSRALSRIPMLYTTSDTCHPNAIGHRLLADEIYDRLFVSGGDF
ncbi:MAG: hypothetical protein JXI33_05160 [Candidatus Aminicenantes bacterium]|nr:hypothetical protein [Candidatus Aminicenantes bacterium]